MGESQVQLSEIMIDARVASSGGHGIACHTCELIRELAVLETPSVHFTLLVNPGSPLYGFNLPSQKFSFIEVKWHWLSLVGLFDISRKLFSLRPSLFHSPSFMVPPFVPKGVRRVATLHDMNHLALVI